MKTTIDLPDDLIVAVKRRAAEDHSTMRAMVERGLRAQLRTPKGRTTRAGRRLLTGSQGRLLVADWRSGETRQVFLFRENW